MTNKRTGAKPISIGGVEWNCYHVGILRYEWRSEDGRCTAGSRSSGTYWSTVDGSMLKTRFRSLKNAMIAAFDEAMKVSA